MSPMADFSLAEAMLASGRSAEKMSLPTLQSKMKCDPEGYETELRLVYSQFKSSVELFEQQAAMSFTSVSGIAADPTVAKDLGDRAMFLAHVTPFYPEQLSLFPEELTSLLRSSARTLPSGLRVHLTQALILLINRKIVNIEDTLALFLELQALGDRTLKSLAFLHVVNCIRRMNQKHKNDPKNRVLQNVLFTMLQQEDEAKAKRSLVTLFDLHKRKVWFDDRTANAICNACFHASSRIMISALSFLLDYEKVENDSDDSGSDDEPETPDPQIILNKESVYKASHKGTTSSKKKKKAKLQRVIRGMKRQQKKSSEKDNTSYYSPLSYLKDAQGFAEKLFSRLQSSNERFQVKMMMMKVVARTVGLHRLILLNFYPYLQKYVQPHQRDVTSLLAAAVQACHDMVPPDAVEPLFKQIVNQFVHDRSRPEAISVGINAVREICLRMPLLMSEDLLQDLVLYKKSNEKAVSSAARSLLTLFREVCPALLVKKDRGRPTNPKARPKAYGEVNVPSNVPGVELLEDDDGGTSDGSNSSSDHFNDDQSDEGASAADDSDAESASEGEYCGSDDESGDGTGIEEKHSEDLECPPHDGSQSDSDNSDAPTDEEGDNEAEEEFEVSRGSVDGGRKKSRPGKRKYSDIDEQINVADKSLRALKRLTEAKMGNDLEENDGILSNEDFRLIKERMAKKEVRTELSKHGFKIPTADQLTVKRVDASKLEANIRKKFSKEERLEMIRAGREERGKYQARTALKKKKTGGSSNRQKEHKKAMPLAARRDKITKSRQQKKIKNQRAGKQFRGRKAWK